MGIGDYIPSWSSGTARHFHDIVTNPLPLFMISLNWNFVCKPNSISRKTADSRRRQPPPAAARRIGSVAQARHRAQRIMDEIG